MTYIDTLLKELKETWDFTTEELDDIKEKMTSYAIASNLDSLVRAEIDDTMEKEFKLDK